MAILYAVDGTVTEVHPASGKVFTLKELQGFVGGYIELVRLGDGRNMWINEEGKLQGLPLNVYATQRANLQDDFIVGPALVCTNAETEGDEDEDAD